MLPPWFVDDALADRQSQAQASALFRGIKRLKDFRQKIFFDTDTAVGDTHHQGRRCVIGGSYLRRYGQLAAVGHGIDGVSEKD